MTAFRLTMNYVVALVIGVITLLTLIYAQATVYLSKQGDGIVLGQTRALMSFPLKDLPDEINKYRSGDLRDVNFFGLFDSNGTIIAGNVTSLPRGLLVDGQPHELTEPGFQPGARALAQRLANGQILFVGYDAKTLTGLRAILLQSLIWSGAIILLGGFTIGALLSFEPLRRVSNIQRISRKIASGDLSQRLPVSGVGDELDVLSMLINNMVSDMEHLMEEVKSLGDNVAHDLRTPLNQLRAHLHRALEEYPVDEPSLAHSHARLVQALVATDVLLGRFRAIQRISEIDSRARSAGMMAFDASSWLFSIVEDFLPVAEESGISLKATIAPGIHLMADRELLAEALYNLLDNALKFTPSGGQIELRLLQLEEGIRFEVQDNGPGIVVEDRSKVLHRFGRSKTAQTIPGAGLGLAIVAAVARVHRYELLLEDANPGLRVVIQTTHEKHELADRT